MEKITYILTLKSDATPGTGLGGEIINEYVARDADGGPRVPASHIKGLIRQELRNCLALLPDWDYEKCERFISMCLGSPGLDGDVGREGLARFSDAGVKDKNSVNVRLITRTAIDDKLSRAKDTSLRTTEAIPAGTKFTGTVFLSCPPDAPAAKAVRMALLSLSAIGKSRHRGSGSCIVNIDKCPDKPGALLKELGRMNTSPTDSPAGNSEPVDAGNAAPVYYRLRFHSDSPVCCPETPVRHNVITSGFAIPASAVQGALLHHVQAKNPAAADALFASDRFRAWPLLPSCGDGFSAIRVSLTHRASKLASGERCDPFWIQDEAFAPYDWEKVPAGAPLKAADGVLLSDGKSVWLWKSAAMPRMITAHGVHNDAQTENGRNLYSVAAMAQGMWTGLLAVPAFAAEYLEEKIELFFGKSRGVRGHGVLQFEKIDDPVGALAAGSGSSCVLVVQSPVRLPDTPPSGVSLEKEFKDFADAWAKPNGLGGVDAVWGVQGVRFGWSRHGGVKGRICARRVVLPGGVVRLTSCPDGEKLAAALLAGLGEGREEGFGALAVHPGIASGLYEGNVETRRLESSADMKRAVKLVLECSAQRTLPSASQVRALQAKYANSGKIGALEYFTMQLNERTNRIWSAWKPIEKQVEALLDLKEPAAVQSGFELLANLILSR